MSLAVLPICRLADRYDADNTVEASGTAPISFSLVSGPAGMTVSAAGVVARTPVSGQEEGQLVQIQTENAVGVDTQDFTIDVAVPRPPPAVSISMNSLLAPMWAHRMAPARSVSRTTAPPCT